jgi:hypothetical protein
VGRHAGAGGILFGVLKRWTLKTTSDLKLEEGRLQFWGDAAYSQHTVPITVPLSLVPFSPETFRLLSLASCNNSRAFNSLDSRR